MGLAAVTVFALRILSTVAKIQHVSYRKKLHTANRPPTDHELKNKRGEFTGKAQRRLKIEKHQ